jgi:hypothetical protein
VSAGETMIQELTFEVHITSTTEIPTNEELRPNETVSSMVFNISKKMVSSFQNFQNRTK